MPRRPPNQVVQYDLFGEVEASERAAALAGQALSADASAFLVGTPWPELLGWWLHPAAIEAMLTHGEAKASYRRAADGGPGWAWAIWRDGLRFESGQTWGGWSARPKWCIPWTELHRLRDGLQHITERLLILAEGRGNPRSVGWRWWMDPSALRPDGVHPETLSAERQADWYDHCERADTAFTDRMEAWNLVLGAAGDACLTVIKAGR